MAAEAYHYSYEFLSNEEFFRDVSDTWKFAELEVVLQTVVQIDTLGTWDNWEKLCLGWKAMLTWVLDKWGLNLYFENWAFAYSDHMGSIKSLGIRGLYEVFEIKKEMEKITNWDRATILFL